MRFIVDIETNNLLSNGLDYSKIPFKLKADYRLWCIVIRNIDTKEVAELTLNNCTKKNLQKALEGCSEVIGHNIIGFDFPVLKLSGILDYTVAYPDKKCTIFGNEVEITDTLIWSKLLNPDRRGGHSLAEWGRRLGNKKQNFHSFDEFTPEMLEYCVQDTSTNQSVYFDLKKEAGDHNWKQAYEMERKLVDLTFKQELFGFAYNSDLAKENLEKLTELMLERSERVSPILPPKQLAVAALKEFTPPKIQFKKDGSISSNLEKFAAKHSAEINVEARTFTYKGQVLNLPLTEPIETTEVASIDDIDVVKGMLLGMGWYPSEVKERDLVKNTDKSLKNETEILAAIDRYVKQTEKSLFRDLRLDLLECSMSNLKTTLKSRIKGSKPIYVPTTPRLQVGVEKEICPNLEVLGDKASFVKDVCEYFTYRHRKNSIAGGTLDEDGDPVTGFLSNVREDGRIPTPADTLGANTGRYRHKIVCNIPRVTSLFGEEMRNMFGSGKGLYQLGFDFASLEARIQGHYCLPYTDGAELAATLVAEKPNDIHSVNARKLGITRPNAKNFSYATMYGAQPKKLSKMLGVTQAEGERLFEEYWKAVPALAELKQKLEKFWESTGKTWVLGIDGRKIMSRSKHSLINVLFQSGGAILAKWALVYIAEILEEQNLLGDPFQHSIGELKVWMMIAMHDEAQYAVHPRLLNIRVFKDDEEAKQNLEKGCSAIGHSSKGSYLGYETSPVKAISEGIKKACVRLKTRVDMGFEWVPGKSWGQCH